jgi:hypothetical protein
LKKKVDLKVVASFRSAALAKDDDAAPAGKPVSGSRSQMVEVVLPNDANPLGYMLGGRVMHLIDIAGDRRASSCGKLSCNRIRGLSGFS